MSDFIAQIQAQLDLSSAKSQLDSFIKQCESQKIKFQIDPTSLNTGTLSKQMQDQIKALSKNLSVSKFTPDIIDYAKMKKKSQEEIEKISETMYKGLYGANGSNKSTTKWANQYTSDAKKMAQIAAKQQEDVAKTIGNIQKKVTTGNYSATASKNESQLMKYIGIDSDTLSQARKYATEYQNIISDLTKHFDTKNAFKLDDSQIVQMGQRLETLGTTFKNTMTQISNDPSMNLTKNIDTYATKFNEIQAKFQTLQSSFNKSGTNELGAAGYEKVNALIVQATTAQAKFNAELQKGNSANLDNLNADMREFNSLAQKAATEYAKLMSPASAIKQQTLLDQMNVWAKANPRAIKAGASQWEGMLNSLSGKTLTVGQLNDVTSQVKNYKLEMELAGKTGKSFFGELGRGFKQIGQFAVTYGVIQNVIGEIGKSINELKDVNTILTEISKTSDLTTSQLKTLGEEAFDKASRWGRSASDYLLGVQEMSRSGYYGKRGEDMANLSILAQSAGGMDADMANSYLLASNAAFEYQGNVEKLNALLDGQNMINKMVMLYGNIWLHNWLLSWNIQRWTTGRISY